MIVRGYPVHELCRRRSFEEVAYLRWHGELPTQEQICAQNRTERAQRAIAPGIAAAIARQPLADHPLDTLRAAVRLLGADDAANHDPTPRGTRDQALQLFAVLPAVIAMDQRRRNGLGAIAPRDHLGYAANLLYMTFGKVPEPQIVAAFETSLILYSGLRDNAAPFATARSDLYSTVAAAMAALKDPSHPSAGQAVMEMMDEIAVPGNARLWLAEALADGRRIAGFDRRDGQDSDSRVPAMRAALGMIAALRGGGELVEVYDALTTAMHEVKGLLPSLDYPAGLSYRLIGFDTSAFAPILVAASLPGWTARIASKLAASNPVLPSRPLAVAI